MCDTFVATGQVTADGSTILGKNSDREPNEAHEISVVPAADYPPGSMLQCTYREIPQAAHTYAVLLSKPFWIWGAEMGVNEHGVAIGNEAIFTRVPYETAGGLIGMDFLRLGLERGRTALEALHTITGLLEQFGQGGSCGLTHPFYYHNSYLIADPQEAWVLETAGKQWVAEKVNGIRSISNVATIGAKWDLASADLVNYAVERKWCKGRDDFDFSRCYSDFLYTNLSDARSRRSCTTRLLAENRGKIDPGMAMQFLRSHGNRSGGDRRIDRELLGANVCMHAGAGPVRNSQSVGSLVAHLRVDTPTAWVTGTSAPCTSIFKPVWLDAGLPLSEPLLDKMFDERCLWWRHEVLHRAVLEDYPTRIAAFEAERDALEARFLAESAECAESRFARREFTARCFQSAMAAEQEWLERVRSLQPTQSTRFYYNRAWKKFNHQAGMV